MIHVVGHDCMVRLLDGRTVRYVDMDNTATTPPMIEVREVVRSMEEVYGSVHRGSGFKSFFSTWAFERARSIVAEQIGADPSFHQVLFSTNTTAASNKAARILDLSHQDVVLVSEIEHSSNDLPWRRYATLKRYRVNRDTRIDVTSVREAIRRVNGRARLVCITGASNVTGYIPPIRDIASVCHEHGIPLFLDAAQLAPHQALCLAGTGAGDRIDFAVFSGHKLGAPYGAAVLVSPRKYLDGRSIPADEPGGGTTDILTEERPYWTSSPDRFESGTPNAIGAIALAKALSVLRDFGWDRLEMQEHRLWNEAVGRLEIIRGVRLYVSRSDGLPRTPIIPFNIDGMPHGLVAAALGFEHGIGLRHGRHCADGLILRLLGIDHNEQAAVVSRVAGQGLKTDVYGVVRPSIGFYTTDEDVDRLCVAIESIAKEGPAFKYEPQMDSHPAASRKTRQTGEYWPVDMPIERILASSTIPKHLDFLGASSDDRATPN